MIKILGSRANNPNPRFKEEKRNPEKEDNVAWLKRNRPCSEKYVSLVLVGGKSEIDFRLRVAQSHARHDLHPSHWSHALLLKPKPKGTIYEISLDPPCGFGFPTPENALQTGQVTRYKDLSKYPNVAVIGVPLSWSKVENVLDQFRLQRTVLDSLELVLPWLAFIWGAAESGNPLLHGQGIPSAAMLEVVLNGAGYDITPGLESRSSCPEAIWQAAKWWHKYYKEQGLKSMRGAYVVSHKL